MNIPVNVTIEHKVNRSSSSAWMTDHMPPIITLYTWIHFCLQLLNLKNLYLRDGNLIKTCKGLSISSGCWCQDQWMVKRIITEDVQNFAEPQFVLLCQVLRLYDQQEHMRARIRVSHRFPRVLLVCLQRCWNEADLVCWWELSLCFESVHVSSTLLNLSLPVRSFPLRPAAPQQNSPRLRHWNGNKNVKS